MTCSNAPPPPEDAQTGRLFLNLVVERLCCHCEPFVALVSVQGDAGFPGYPGLPVSPSTEMNSLSFPTLHQ